MKKIFTFFFAALMSVGMYATTVVTITQNDFPRAGKSFTKDGVTVSAGNIDGTLGNLMMGGSFSTTLGNFTQIEVSANDESISGPGWAVINGKKTWRGKAASSVSFGGNIMGNGQGVTLVFTIAEPTVAVTGVTLNQNEAQMTVGGETLTLTATVNPNNATNQSVSWSTSDANVATVKNGVVTAVAAGTATITVTTTDGSFTATCAVTVSNPAPAGEVTVVFAANNNTVEKTVTLPHNFSCSYENKDGELDALIKELYEISAGHCSDDNYPVASGNEAVLAGSNGFDNYITISAAFEGTATVSGWYWNSDAYDGDGDWMDYTLTISIKGDEPEPTAIENVQTNHVQGTKILRDGQLLIVRDGKTYNVLGTMIQ